MLSKETIEKLEQQRKYDENERAADKLDFYAGRLNDIIRAIDTLQKEHYELWSGDDRELIDSMSKLYDEAFKASGRAKQKAQIIRRDNK
jgi:hypothetical protein